MDPITITLGAVLLIFGLAIPCFSLIKLSIVDGLLDFSVAAGLFFAMLVVIAAVAAAGGAVAAFATIAVMVLLSLLVPLGLTLEDKSLGRKMNRQDFEKFQKALQFDPRNAAAHAGLGLKYLEYKLYEPAAIHLRQAVTLSPDSPNSHVWRHRLEEAEARQTGQVPVDTIICSRCELEMPSNTRNCPRCGELQRMGFGEWLIQPANFKAVVRDTVQVFCVVIALLAVFSALPWEWKGVVLMATAIVLGRYLLRGIEG